jgi:Ser/Thr protein kinase RdoA (MazF antagonist)
MSAPSITIEDAACIVQEHYGIAGEKILKISSLGSCQDCNFKLVLAHEDGKIEKFVLKISNLSIRYEDLAFENSVLDYLGARYQSAARAGAKPLHSCIVPSFTESSPGADLPQNNASEVMQIPRALPMLDGHKSIAAYKQNHQTYHVRLLSFIDGHVLSECKYLCSEVLMSFGRFIAELDELMSGFTAPAPSLSSKPWDMRGVMTMIDQFETKYQLSSDPYAKRLLDVSRHMNATIMSMEARFHSQLVHGDLAYYNVIATAERNGRSKITGIIDFGDICQSWVLGNLAIAITPCLIQEHRPAYTLAGDILKGYIQYRPLNREEILCLWPLIIQRSILLYFGIFHQLQEDPDNKYCQDEYFLNKQIVENILKVPLLFAQNYFLQIADYSTPSLEASIPGSISKPSIDGLMDVDVHYLDLGVKSEVYLNGDWNYLDEVAAVKQFIRQTENNPRRLVVVPWGVPILSKTKLLSHETPSTIPLFTRISSSDEIKMTFPASIQIQMLDDGMILSYGEVSIILKGSNELKEDEGQRILTTLPVDSLHMITIQIVAYAASNMDPLPPAYCIEADFPAWSRLCPDPTIYLGLSAFNKSADEELSLRYEFYAKVQEHYFRHPPVIERGYRQYMYDKSGRAYLDMVNNVAVIGHSHEAITKAATKQLGKHYWVMHDKCFHLTCVICWQAS